MVTHTNVSIILAKALKQGLRAVVKISSNATAFSINVQSLLENIVNMG
jgi:hypothetical protein